MAKWINRTEAQDRLWEEWLSNLEPELKEVMFKYDLQGDELYSYGEDDVRVKLRSVEADGTVTVELDPKYNDDKQVIVSLLMSNINPARLVPCDNPLPVEEGSIYETYVDGEKVH